MSDPSAPPQHGKPPTSGANRGIRRRSASHCVKTCVFYVLFYYILVTLTAVYLWVFFKTIDSRIPKWQLDQSIIGTNPGLSVRPMFLYDGDEITFIRYNASDTETYRTWTESLEYFISGYEYYGVSHQNIYNCDYDKQPPEGKVCDVNPKNWHPCTRENNFNFHKSSPCIFLKLNRIYGWLPEYYNDTEDLPPDMPTDLKQHIAEKEKNTESLNTVWVSCEGKSNNSKESIGPIQYLPTRGFPGYYYPYMNTEYYQSPLVAVYLERPDRGILIDIECKAWARNIKHDRDRSASILFDLLID